MKSIEEIASNSGLVRATDPETSKHAACTLRDNAHRHWALVDVMMDAHPQGLTHWEMEQRTGDENVRTRCRELELGHWLERSAGRRAGRRGRPAIVWILTEGALDYYGG